MIVKINSKNIKLLNKSFHMETKVNSDQMLLHKYLETLMGSKTKIKILRTLTKHRGKEYTIRELANSINTSHTGVNKALQDLYEMNIINIKTTGRAHAIQLNEKSILTPTLTHLFQSETQTIQELQNDIKQHLCNKPTTKSVKIYGSIAKATEKPRSDIDLLIISTNPEKTEEHITDLQIHCNQKYGNPITPHIITPQQTQQNKLLKEIEKNHIKIC